MHNPAPKLDVQAHGLDLLKLTNDVLMQEFSNLWVASGLFAAANSLLVVALFSTPYTTLSLGVISLFGLVLSGAWTVAIQWARERIAFLRPKVSKLVEALGIPEELAPWGTFGKGSLRVPRAVGLVDILFYGFWAFVLTAAGGTAGLYRFP